MRLALGHLVQDQVQVLVCRSRESRLCVFGVLKDIEILLRCINRVKRHFNLFLQVVQVLARGLAAAGELGIVFDVFEHGLDVELLRRWRSRFRSFSDRSSDLCREKTKPAVLLSDLLLCEQSNLLSNVSFSGVIANATPVGVTDGAGSDALAPRVDERVTGPGAFESDIFVCLN